MNFVTVFILLCTRSFRFAIDFCLARGKTPEMIEEKEVLRSRQEMINQEKLQQLHTVRAVTE